MKIKISILPYVGGDFDVILKDSDSEFEVILSGKREFTNEELEFIQKVAPPCVFTEYNRSE